MQRDVIESARRSRFPKRITFHEDPDVLEHLSQLASEGGRTTSSEIRSAIRWWIKAFEPEDPDDD